ncbi:MAG: OmpA family protein [Granulosicoccus sp.]
MPIMMRTFTTLAAGLLAYVLVPAQASALEGSWHAGIQGGVSLLSPETDGSAFTLDEDQSTAVGIYLGLDITPVISAEIAFTDLGEAELSQNQTIAYEAVSIGAVAYILGEKHVEDRAEGASLYVRLGFSAIDNEAEIELTESNNTALWLGAGVQFPVSRRWGLRAELTSFDGDAQAVMAGIFWRTGAGSAQNPPAAPAADSLTTIPAESDAVVTAVPVPQPLVEAPAVRESVIEPPAEPVASQQVPECPAADSISDPDDCMLLNDIATGLDFVGNSADITPQGRSVLDDVIATMKNYPALILEIRVHTQSLDDEALEQKLSAERAKSVARYMVQNGVPVSQLRAKAFGATQPVAVNGTLNGRRLNNRVEFKSN